MSGLVVVIPTHSRRALLRRAVASCAPWPVVVVDDSPHGMAPLPDVHWVRGDGSGGYSTAVNHGLEAAARLDARAALVLNDDAVLLDDCVARLYAVWRDRGGAVGPLIEDDEGRLSSAGISLSAWGRLTERREAVSARVHPVQALSGACLLVGTSWRFDPAFSHGMEDVALCRRIRAAGGGVWLVGDARCRHAGGATLARTSPEAQRAAVAGHLRLLGGGLHTPVVLGLAVAQILREGGGAPRLRAVVGGWNDWRRPDCSTRHSIG